MVEPQPTKKPEWNTGGSNRTEPTSGEKVSGWVLNDEPPSSYFNWLQYYTYAWLEWLNERMFKTSAEIDLTVRALTPDTAGNGGDLTLRSGNADTSGTGGNIDVFAGTGIGAKGGDITLRSGASDATPGDIAIRGGNTTGSGRGGDIAIETGDGVGSRAGNLTISCGTTDTEGGDVSISAGDNTGSGVGGFVSLTAGAGDGAEGGDVTITAGASDTDGGDVTITGGQTSSTGGPGGDVELAGGAAIGSTGDGGDATLKGGGSSVSGDGGSVVIDGGDALGGGEGGDVTITGGVGTGAEGGDVTITAGQSNSAGGDLSLGGGAVTGTGTGGSVAISGGDSASGRGGNLSILAGAAAGAFEGGDIFITGGASTTDDGGDVQVRGGSPSGNDQAGGNVTIRSGTGRGNQGGRVDIEVSEAGASGGTERTPVDYIECNGLTGNKNVQVKRYLEVDNTSDTTRGEVKVATKSTVPTSPAQGDIWHDSQAKQIKLYNGSRHAAMNQLIWNATEQEYFGVTPTGPLSTSTNYVLQQQNYSGGGVTTNAFRSDLLANALREGAILRVRGAFVLTTDGTPPANRFTPDIVIMLGTVGSGPPYTGSSGDRLGDEGSFGSDQVWSRCAVECEGRYWEASSVDYLDITWKYLFEEDAASPNPLSSLVKLGGSINTETFNAGVNLSVFPRADMGIADAAWKVECEQFVVELL